MTAGPPESPRFLCLLGIDGSGKSALLEALRCRRRDVVTVHWSQIVAGMTIPTLPPGLGPVEVLRQLGPYARAAQLCYIAALEYDTVVRPALAEGQLVVVDSYWYKFSAKMNVLGLAAPFLELACRALPSPSRVVFLDTPPETACRRKPHPNFFECAGDPDGFIPFQHAVRAEMLRLVGRLPVVFLDGRAPLDEQTCAIEKMCADVCAPSRPLAMSAGLGDTP